jgi:hypothetical protein
MVLIVTPSKLGEKKGNRGPIVNPVDILFGVPASVIALV